MTVHQKLKRAYEKNKGIKLSADEVFTLFKMDDAVETCAANDDEADAEKNPVDKEKRLSKWVSLGGFVPK